MDEIQIEEALSDSSFSSHPRRVSLIVILLMEWPGA